METTPDASILVIEDNADLNLALCEILGSYGYRIRSAANGFEALDSIRAEKPDVILCDIMMPGMDGYETTREIRKLPQWSNLPIIAVTAKAMHGDRDKCLDAGANDYLTKPVDLDKLLSMMRVWLQK